MRVKLDENMPTRLVAALNVRGHDVHTVASEGLKGRPDSDIWQAVLAERRLLVTQDLEFADLRRYPVGTHAGILLVRHRDPGRDALLRRVVSVFETECVADWYGCLAIVSERKMRVVRPSRRP